MTNRLNFQDFMHLLTSWKLSLTLTKTLQENKPQPDVEANTILKNNLKLSVI
jgi:hypothetical protein